MKKHIILVLALVLSSGPLFAQSSHMTDDQVMSFVVKEHERGTSNSQIVTKLMQQGVDISQIRRVRNKYQKMSQQNELYSTSAAGNVANKRMRTNNGKQREDYQNKDNEKLSSTIVAIASRASRTTATIHLMMRIILTMLTSARR